MAEDARHTEGTADPSGPPPQAVGSPTPPPPAPEPAPAAPAAPAPEKAEEEDGKLDPQLIGMAVVLWLLAVGIFVFKWDRLRVDWYLGNIKETGDLSKRLDEPSMHTLAEMASGDEDVLRMVGEEVVGPLANRDWFYRVALVRTLERVPGPGALSLVSQAAQTDIDGVVRANAYRALGARALKDPAEKEHATSVLVRALGEAGEPEPMARAYAIEVVAELGAKQALWPVIRAVREARGAFAAQNREAADAGEKALREKGAAAFWALSGTTKEQLPFDAGAELATRDEQVRAWERWFASQPGNEIPKGDSLDEKHPPTASQQQPEQPPQQPQSQGSQ